MVRRRVKRKRQRIARASDDDVPDPASALIIGLSAAGTAAGVAATKHHVDAKNQQKALAANKPPASPLVAAPDTLKPGEKINAINTTPYGVLEAPNTARSTLLGGIR